MSCLFKRSCGYEVCMDEDCPEYREKKQNEPYFGEKVTIRQNSNGDTIAKMTMNLRDHIDELCGVAGIPFERLQEIFDAERDGRCVVLPCKVAELSRLYDKLTEPAGDEAETYTTGYRSGHKNGKAELIAYLLQIDAGTRAEAEVKRDEPTE